jgi:multidrug efflux system membrane fusion protein
MPDQTAAYRTVSVGQTFSGLSLIERGVAKGELVVTEGYYRLQNGSPIEIERVPLKPISPTVQSLSRQPG